VLNDFDGDGVNYAVDGYGDNMMGGVLSGGWEAEEYDGREETICQDSLSRIGFLVLV
jgi:hypothetical protein